MADDTTQKTPIRVRLNACDISFFEKYFYIKKKIYICACQDSTFWRMYHNINYQTMIKRKNQVDGLRSQFNQDVMHAIRSAALQVYPDYKTFAKECQIDRSNLSRLFKGQNSPSLDLVAVMLEKAQVSVVLILPRKFKVL